MDENANFKADCTAQLPPPAWRPFRFLQLPAEMRNLIYGLLLAPDGHIGLLKLQCTAEDRHLKDVVFPDARLRFTCDAEHYILSGCSPQILAVCQQIYGEAKQIMYEENTVCATVAIWTGVLVLNKCLLPDSMLRRLTSLLLACDAAESSTMDSEWFTQLPWKQLQDLTSLRNLRLSLIERESQNDTTRSKKFILEHILERIPASCNVTFVSREGFEDTYVQEVIDETQAQMARRRHVMNVDDVHEVEGRVLEALAKQCMHKQGRKSGHERDYRFPDRSIATVIGKLMPLTKISDVDPHLVLGGTGGRWR
ncbi:hypothetical protein DOTSEDRAFT_74750 [Dothistroma septosporum NZE10]|uniref:F-box domain-containing protein n=1 Tax=Dothistroma septosporum (strain NZE10 / CBS 128990) TaxID=675120 RepID=N1PFA6_DOTSN|nr:hypothetical protein DOTSEDRAFT_74750 [Dothistroma septosporum NZE10]